MTLGMSANMVVIPYVITYLHAEFGSRGAILITGGVCLNQIPASMLFHPVEWHSKKPPRSSSIQGQDSKTDHFRAIVQAFKNNFSLLKFTRVIVISLPYGVYFAGVTFTISYIPFVIQTTGYFLEDSAYCLMMMGIFHILTTFIRPCLPFDSGASQFFIVAAGYGALPVTLLGKTIDLIQVINLKIFWNLGSCHFIVARCHCPCEE